MNKEESAKIEALLQKYKTGECTPEEETRIELWLEELNGPKLNVAEKRRSLRNIRKQVLNQTQSKNEAKTIHIYQYLKIAAVLLLVPMALLFYNRVRNSASQTELVFTTLRGEQKTLMLPDSSVVVLNASSSLTINRDFNKKKRIVTLSGEGYFNIKHDVTKPFLVNTGHIQTQVLGTQFNVHAYPNEDDYKIAVTSGCVSVSENSGTPQTKVLGKMLTRNLMITYNQKNRQHFIENADADKLSGWQHGAIYFEDASITEIANTLARQYNTDVQLTGTTGRNCKYTIGFNHQPLDKTLRVLSELTGFSYRYASGKIIIHSQNCR
jgi:transmembrane sensor